MMMGGSGAGSAALEESSLCSCPRPSSATRPYSTRRGTVASSAALHVARRRGAEVVEAAQTTTAFFSVPPTHIELVHPLEGRGPIATYLDKRGGALHHLCFRSDDIDADVARLRDKGYQFTSDAPTPGAHGSRVIFIHPKSCDGVLIELSQPAEAH